jgi:hypothetical protein
MQVADFRGFGFGQRQRQLEVLAFMRGFDCRLVDRRWHYPIV